MQYAITDIETSGRSNKITDIGIVVYDDQLGEIVETYESLVNPECSIDPFVQGMTGITNDMVADAPRFFEIAKEVFQITENRVFIAHNVGFDYNIIRQEFKDLGGAFNRKKLCTIRLARTILPGLKSYGLGNLCKELAIKNHARHRAMGDAMATTDLFQILLDHDNENHLGFSLKKISREATLPPNLERKTYDMLPHSTGVYYFHNQEGRVIYVGKAKDIRSRVTNHFLDQTAKKLRMNRETYDISYKETGTELLALLIEAHEIKEHFPEYNSAQKYTGSGYVLTNFKGMDGIERLEIVKKQKYVNGSLAHFSNVVKAREFLFKLVEEYKLCPKFCGLQKASNSCFDEKLEKCKGVCCGKEPVGKYNKRLRRAISSFTLNLGTYVIKQKGRVLDEFAYVLIEDGIYRGYTFVDKESQIEDLESMKDIIVPQIHNSDIQHILVSHLRKTRNKNTFRL